MRKLFLGIILGSLFFVYGERPDINLGDRIGDKINFVGAKGENYYLHHHYDWIVIGKDGKQDVAITGDSCKFNIASGNFEAVNNTNISDIYYTLKEGDVNKTLQDITRRYEDIPFSIEKFKDYAKRYNEATDKYYRDLIDFKIDRPPLIWSECKYLFSSYIYVSSFMRLMKPTAIIEEKELSYNVKRVKIDYKSEYEKVLNDETYLNEILTGLKNIKYRIDNDILWGIIDVKFEPNIEYAYKTNLERLCFNFKKKGDKIIYTAKRELDFDYVQCYEYYEKDLENDDYIQHAFGEYFTRIYKNYEGNKKERILAYLAYKAESSDQYLFSVVE